MHAPLWIKIFLISCSFGEKSGTFVCCTPPGVGAPSYGKFWIRPWFGMNVLHKKVLVQLFGSGYSTKLILKPSLELNRIQNERKSLVVCPCTQTHHSCIISLAYPVGRTPPVQFLSFSWDIGVWSLKRLPNNRFLLQNHRLLRPPPRKFWIRHCIESNLVNFWLKITKNCDSNSHSGFPLSRV